MKIIKEGKLPTPCKVVMEGTCTHCGCVVQEEHTVVFQKKMFVLEEKCPTYGCLEYIALIGRNPQMPSEYYNIPCGS